MLLPIVVYEPAENPVVEIGQVAIQGPLVIVGAGFETVLVSVEV